MKFLEESIKETLMLPMSRQTFFKEDTKSCNYKKKKT